MRQSNPDAQPSNPNVLKRFITPALVTGLAIAALTGCTANAAPTPNITHSATSTPSAEHTKAPDRFPGSDFERTDPLPAFLEAADKATPDEFKQLPKKEQIQWATWAGQYKDQFIAYFSKVSALPEDASYTLTTDSDAKALLTDRAYEQRIAANFGTGTPTGEQFNGALDKDMITKYLMAFTTNDSTDLGSIDTFISQAGEKGQAFNVAEEAELGSYDVVVESQKSGDYYATPNTMVFDGESLHAFRVSWTSGDTRNNFVIGAYPTVDYKNQPIVVAVVSQ